MGFSTEDCKALLAGNAMAALHGAADAKNWKRMSKKKNAAGNVERVFAHARGLWALVEESGGALSMKAFGRSEAQLRSAGVEAVEALSDKHAPGSVLEGYTLVCSDEAAAQKAKRDWEECVERDEFYDLSELLEKNDPVGVANCFIFAVCPESEFGSSGSLDVVITPYDYWKQTGYIDDMSMAAGIGALLPEYELEEVAESTFVVWSDSESKEQILGKMLSKGFMWNEECQRMVDSGSGQDGVAFVNKVAGCLRQKRELGELLPVPSANKPKPKL